MAEAEINQLDFFREIKVLAPEIIGDYYIGLYQMMFGIRIRAGELFDDDGCEIDICGGQSMKLILTIKQLYALKMRDNLNKGLKPFEGLRPNTELKPANNDPDFMIWLAKLTEEVSLAISYSIGYDEDEKAEYIHCHSCNKKSYSPGDIEHLYCGMCGEWHTVVNRI